MMYNHICVFCSSRVEAAQEFGYLAEDLAKWMVAEHKTLVFGGSDCGLMRTVAESCRLAGVRVVGVIPKFLNDRGIAFREADEVILSEDLRSRKRDMDNRSDAFLVFPGGIGTLDEVIEIITIKSLRESQKPVIFVDPTNIYDYLFQLLDSMVAAGLVSPPVLQTYVRVSTIDEVADYLHSLSTVESVDE